MEKKRADRSIARQLKANCFMDAAFAGPSTTGSSADDMELLNRVDWISKL